VASEDIKRSRPLILQVGEEKSMIVASYYSKFDSKLPDALRKQLLELHQRLG